MIQTFIKHLIYEMCINVMFSNIHSNFCCAKHVNYNLEDMKRLLAKQKKELAMMKDNPVKYFEERNGLGAVQDLSELVSKRIDAILKEVKQEFTRQ